MFDRVCGQVNLQTGSICVTTITVVALEGLVFVVLPTVRLWGEDGRGGWVSLANLDNLFEGWGG